MASASKVLVTNQSISAPLTSPGVKLQGSLSYWEATLDVTAHAGTDIQFTIQGSADNKTFTDFSKNEIQGADGIGKFGNDLSNSVQSFLLYGSGPWWRINVTSVTGSILINSLSVVNTDTPS